MVFVTNIFSGFIFQKQKCLLCFKTFFNARRFKKHLDRHVVDNCESSTDSSDSRVCDIHEKFSGIISKEKHELKHTAKWYLNKKNRCKKSAFFSIVLKKLSCVGYSWVKEEFTCNAATSGSVMEGKVDVGVNTDVDGTEDKVDVGVNTDVDGTEDKVDVGVNTDVDGTEDKVEFHEKTKNQKQYIYWYTTDNKNLVTVDEMLKDLRLFRCTSESCPPFFTNEPQRRAMILRKVMKRILAADKALWKTLLDKSP
ncbi:hypothetical protein TNCT_323161 [Trichonephila clavata]|uniref:C2H2-type domain-containing protein n=1 Tax=Trichonephila clavata TaxID=2740835 RepID=A0A8X6FWH0_TRICU|nr:hypothetical protein TNCT_323161 [Trichonephila clavata]